jgi:hypothetical protein
MTPVTLAELTSVRQAAELCLSREYMFRHLVVHYSLEEQEEPNGYRGIEARRSVAEAIVRLDQTLVAADVIEKVDPHLCLGEVRSARGLSASSAHRLAVKLARRTADTAVGIVLRCWLKGVPQPPSWGGNAVRFPRSMARLKFLWFPDTLTALREGLTALPEYDTAQVMELIRWEFTRASQPLSAPATGASRVLCDPDTHTVTLDGKPYKVEHPRAFAVYAAIVDNRPQPITATRIGEQVRGARGKRAVKAHLDRLPAPLRATVRSGAAGYWFDADGKPRQRRGQKKVAPRPRRAPT